MYVDDVTLSTQVDTTGSLIISLRDTRHETDAFDMVSRQQIVVL